MFTDPRRQLRVFATQTDAPWELQQHVKNLLGCPVDIPWFQSRHDNMPFSSTLSGYARIRRYMHGPPSFRDDLALWVGAMTFGFLEAVTETRISESQLLSRRSDGTEVISGEKLFFVLLSWANMHTSRGLAHHEAMKVAALLQHATRALEEIFERSFVDIFLRCGFNDNRYTAFDVASSIAIMVFTVLHFCFTICHWPDVMDTLVDIAARHDRPLYRDCALAIRRRMLSAGWCPYTIPHSFLTPVSPNHLGNIVRLKPFVRRSIKEHQLCNDDACSFYTVHDTDKYTNPHIHPCPDSTLCAHTAPPPGDIEKILEAGDIPVAVYLEGDLAVLPSAAADVSYVAISHVWADGLGSTSDKGLPACQIARISRLTRSLLPESNGAFWMDSICVPSSRKLRKRAIMLMAKTYEEAKKVLVLDAVIRAQCSVAKTLEENAFHVATSGWIRRVWTLQEGILAQELLFEAADGIITMTSDLLHRTVHPAGLQPGLTFHAYLPLISLHARRQSGERYQFTLPDVARLLAGRTTTNADDETLAIAGLLSLDVQKLLSVPQSSRADTAAQRMRSLYIQLEQLPRDIILNHHAPRLQLPNFRWARSTLATAIMHDMGVAGTATCTESGLRGRYAVGYLDKPVSPPQVNHNAGKIDFWIAVIYAPTQSLFIATTSRHFVAHGGADSETTPSFDCFLFLEEEMSGLAEEECAAVRRCGYAEPVSEREVASEELFRCEYVTSANLMLHTTDGFSEAMKSMLIKQSSMTVTMQQLQFRETLLM